MSTNQDNKQCDLLDSQLVGEERVEQYFKPDFSIYTVKSTGSMSQIPRPYNAQLNSSSLGKVTTEITGLPAASGQRCLPLGRHNQEHTRPNYPYNPAMNSMGPPQHSAASLAQQKRSTSKLQIYPDSEEEAQFLLQISHSHMQNILWKPLLRQFRRYLKRDALSPEIYLQIRERELGQQGLLFCEALGLPQQLAYNLRNQMAVLLMISSHRIVWRKNLIPHAAEMMAEYKDDIWQLFYRGFDQTSQKLRIRFFSEPLIQALWEKFRHSQSKSIREFILAESRPMQSMIMLEIGNVENRASCRILPDDLARGL